MSYLNSPIRGQFGVDRIYYYFIVCYDEDYVTNADLSVFLDRISESNWASYTPSEAFVKIERAKIESLDCTYLHRRWGVLSSSFVLVSQVLSSLSLDFVMWNLKGFLFLAAKSWTI